MSGVESAQREDRGGSGLPRFKVGVLGIITIAVYGAWYYSFGVLLDPMILDTGWSEALLATAFAASVLIGGVGSFVGGWLLDRWGSGVVFGIAAFVGLGTFQVASSTESGAVFAVMVAIGGGTFSAFGFYHITQTTAVRVSPSAPTKAIAVLTIWGAFSSAIYLPAAAWLVQATDWRTTMRLLSSSAVVALIIGMVAVNTRSEALPSGRLVLAELWQALKRPMVRRYVLAIGLVGLGVETILVYQVPAMTAAGLPLTAASFWAGFRGFAQLGGRLPLTPLVGRLGTAGTQRLAIAATSVGMLILAFAGSPVLAALYALLAGFGIGAMSPLQGLHARELFGPSSLGTSMGLLSLVFLLMGSVGPAAAGWVASSTGSRSLPVAAGAVITLLALPLVRRPAG